MLEESRRPSKVERNRDLASPPDTLHAARETWNDFERRVSSFALPLEPCPLDVARVTREKEKERETALIQYMEILSNISSYRATSLLIACFRRIPRKLLDLSRILACNRSFSPNCLIHDKNRYNVCVQISYS
ncbi:hypothetical protein ALC62_01175 [Cyphomyrmex costatus]|uniref:Uncharacterized protein n=1 Tax=Cyphomyrmex costatus TaxID=456900 RepID=A0A151IPT2_9HYME|nr:hypothetical protein ALC62_01175 [Cyphomyrmex costatus]